MSSDQDAANHRIKSRAALASIAASLALTAAKFAAGLMSGSLALLSEAGHGAVDTGATVVTWLAIREAGKPADDEHQFGHGKFEALAALFETGLLFALSAFVVIEGVRRLASRDADIEPSFLAFAVLAIAIAVDLVRWRSLAQIARDTKSLSLEADALHFSSDLVASVLVAAGLIVTAFGYPQADAFAAFGVAAFIAVAGCRLAFRTVDTLLDAAPKGLAQKLRALSVAVPGVEGVEDIRLRTLGGRIAGDISISVARTLPIEQAEAIAADVRSAIQRVEPEAELTVTATPRALDDETILERVLLVSARRRLAVHHITVQSVGRKTSVSFDLEIDGRMTHGAAHDIATSLESGIRDELEGDIEVESHIEPLETRELEGHDADAGLTKSIAESLGQAASKGGTVSDVHEVRVRETNAGLIVNYHCRVDGALSVDAVHDAVDALDHAVRGDNPRIVRMVGHADPL